MRASKCSRFRWMTAAVLAVAVTAAPVATAGEASTSMAGSPVFCAVVGGTFIYIDMVLTEVAAMRHAVWESALDSDQQTLQVMVQLYKEQHDAWPGIDAKGNFDGDLFVAQLTGKTDRDGTVSPKGDLGPYLQEMPPNWFVKKAVATRIKGGEGKPPGDGTSGWWLDTKTGKVSPNDADHKGR